MVVQLLLVYATGPSVAHRSNLWRPTVDYQSGHMASTLLTVVILFSCWFSAQNGDQITFSVYYCIVNSISDVYFFSEAASTYNMYIATQVSWFGVAMLG